jgi:hypothetical protein
VRQGSFKRGAASGERGAVARRVRIAFDKLISGPRASVCRACSFVMLRVVAYTRGCGVGFGLCRPVNAAAKEHMWL